MIKRFKYPLALICGSASFYCYNTYFNKKATPLRALNFSESRVKYTLPTREQHLEQIQKTKEYDLVIIGGGCNGAGVYLEAVSRGLSACLIEQNDFAAGTSSKSTKLIHGGIRYLYDIFELSTQSLQSRIEKYRLLSQALSERNYFIENGYYMNKQIPFVLPTTNLFWASFYYCGVWVYQLIYYLNQDKNSAFRFRIPTFMEKQELKKHFPSLNPKYSYGVIYYDGLFNDTRMCLDLLLTGSLTPEEFKLRYNKEKAQGNILNYAKVQDFDRKEGQLSGVVVKDLITQKEHKINAKCVINCTGAFADSLRKLDNPKATNRIIPVVGSHLVMDPSIGSKKYAYVIPKTSDGRILFQIPWLNQQLVGTTERKEVDVVLNPQVSMEELLFMIRELENEHAPDEKLKIPIQNKIKSKWCGFRPLILEADAIDPSGNIDTKKVARKHAIEQSDSGNYFVLTSGMISLLGGKWTSYRKMGEETVDLIFQQLQSNFLSQFARKRANST